MKDPRQFPLLRNLQYSPIKEQDEQYVVLWDPSGLSADRLVLPLNYFFVIQHFDGEHSLEQVAAAYFKRFGEFFLPERLNKLVADLDEKLFLEGERAAAARRQAQAAYRESPVRPAAFSGRSYEADREKLQAQLESFFRSKEGPGRQPSEHAGKPVKALVAPHYEPRQAGPVYAWAYKELKEAAPPELVVIVGTCQAGLDHAFAVTDKDFETPLGRVPVDRTLLERFRERGGGPFFEEDLAHKSEHAVEFQLPFLQYVMEKRPFAVLPVLCAFSPSDVLDPQHKDRRERIETFIRLFRDTLAASGKAVCVIASAELAHIGLRYGDAAPPTDFSFHRTMQTDMEMLKHVEERDADAFAKFILKEADRRRITGFAPIYTMLRLIQAESGQVLRYDRGIVDQFNSTTTFASMAFY